MHTPFLLPSTLLPFKRQVAVIIISLLIFSQKGSNLCAMRVDLKKAQEGGWRGTIEYRSDGGN